MRLYAIVVPNETRNPKWGMVRNKRKAIKLANEIERCHPNYPVVRAEVYERPDVPEVSAWDWPTFLIGATRVYPV